MEKYYCENCKKYFYGWAEPICPICGSKLIVKKDND
jgi:rRNA maturation endonuclease Nob1